MNIPKPIKVILILVGGMIFLWLLSIAASAYIYNEKNNVSSEIGVVTDGGRGEEPSMGAPDFMGYPDTDTLIYPGFESSGDGSKLIKTATITLETPNVDESLTKVKQQVEDVKGFVQDLSQSSKSNQESIYMVLRVPTTEFDGMLVKLRTLGEVTVDREGATDISGVYQDTQTRLKTQKELEKQLLVLLKKSEKIEDILQLQKELANVRTMIEAYELELKNYDNKVSMSTIQLTITKSSEGLSVTGDSWKPVGVFKEAALTLVDFSKGLVNVLIWAVVFSPVFLIPAGIVWLYRRFRK